MKRKISIRRVVYGCLILLALVTFLADSIYKQHIKEENEIRQQQHERSLKKLEREIALEELRLEVEAINKRNSDVKETTKETE